MYKVKNLVCSINDLTGFEMAQSAMVAPKAPLTALATSLLGYEAKLPGWILIPLFILAWTLFTYLFIKIIERIISSVIRDRVKRTIEALSISLVKPIGALFFLLGLKIAFDSNTFTSEVRGYTDFILKTLLVIVCSIVVIRVIKLFLVEYASRNESVEPFINSSILFLKIVVIVLAVMIWMRATGVPIEPVLATFGIAGLAIGLALQDTLSNLFAGIYMVLDRHLRVGDYVRIADAEEGYVQSIGFRSTRVITTSGRLLIVPNRRLADAVLVNMSLPYEKRLCEIDVSVAIKNDLQQVQDLLADVTKKNIKEIKGILDEVTSGDHMITFTGFDKSRLNFTVSFYISDFARRTVLESELRKRIYLELKRKNIALSE